MLNEKFIHAKYASYQSMTLIDQKFVYLKIISNDSYI